ncbi:hypothetical protein WJT86_06295 [Microvirga sp. W0021]|uniref:Uncharacterized protein n=1 Tax=Hohaiivirga grylli TaxID=3133970 RepID=A0ABV0BI84_9HYPH
MENIAKPLFLKNVFCAFQGNGLQADGNPLLKNSFAMTCWNNENGILLGHTSASEGIRFPEQCAADLKTDLPADSLLKDKNKCRFNLEFEMAGLLPTQSESKHGLKVPPVILTGQLIKLDAETDSKQSSLADFSHKLAEQDNILKTLFQPIKVNRIECLSKQTLILCTKQTPQDTVQIVAKQPDAQNSILEKCTQKRMNIDTVSPCRLNLTFTVRSLKKIAVTNSLVQPKVSLTNSFYIVADDVSIENY